MDATSAVETLAVLGTFSIGIGLARRAHRSVGLVLVAGAMAAAIVLAIAGSWRPFLYLIAVAGLFGGLAVDHPGRPGRRALGLLGLAVFLFALTISAFYA